MKRPEPEHELKYLRITAVALAALLAIAVGYALVAGHSTHEHLQESLEAYPYIDPARHFVPQEDFIVNIQPLRDRLNAMADAFGREHVSIYVEFLNTGANISINRANYIWPASLAKVPIAMAVMKKVEDGDWKLSDELVLMEGDRNDESGDRDDPLAEYPAGTTFTIERLLEELLVNSDNTAFYMFARNLHQDELDRVVEDLGLEALFSSDGRVSAKEYSRLFRALYTASFLDREHSEMLLALLDKAPFDDFLAGGVPREVPFAHKYGEKITLNVYADSGIVYLGNRPYLITVMVQGDEDAPYEEELARAAQFMKDVSKAAYAYFSSESAQEEPDTP